MASTSGAKQPKVTEYFPQTRTHRSPSAKRSKQTRLSNQTGESGEQEKAKESHVSSIPRTPEIHFGAVSVAFLPENAVTLELPATYTLLMSWFRNADQLVAMMYNRKELITFTKLQAGVQKMTRRNFGLKQLGQIKSVYPEAYEYEQQRTTRQASVLQNKPLDYELTIKPNLATDLSSYGLKTPVKSPRKRVDVTPTKMSPCTPTKRPYFALSPMKTPTKLTSEPRATISPMRSPSKDVPLLVGGKPFSGGRMIARSQVFRRNLFGILRRHHKQFLGSLTPPIALNDEEENRLTSWHPQFLLDEQALDIPASELPSAPVVERIASAKDMLAARSGLHPKIKEAIASLTKATKSPTGSDGAQSTSNSPLTGPSVKGIPTKLLEKVRERERQKKERAMLRFPAEERRQLQLSRLPDFVRIINMYFATEGRTVMPSSQVHTKLSDSYATPMTASDIAEHVKLLRDLVPAWLLLTDLGEKGSYLRINRELDVTDVLKQLEKS